MVEPFPWLQACRIWTFCVAVGVIGGVAFAALIR